MAKGRKRKTGRREPNGRISRAGRSKHDVRNVVLAQPHRAWLGQRGTDAAAECVAGMAHLAGLITEPQWWAAIRYRRLVDSFHVVMATPMTRQSAAAIGVAAGMEAPAEADFSHAEREDEVERRDRVTDAMNAASEALTDAGVLVAREVNAVVIEDQLIDRIDRLRAGLDVLVRLWRLDAQDTPRRRAYWRDERPEGMEVTPA